MACKAHAQFFFAVFWYGYLGYNYFTVRVCQGDSQRLFVRDYFLDVGRCHWCFFLAKWNSKTSEVHSSAFMDKIGFWWSSTFMSMTYLICYTYSPYSNGRFLFFGLSLSPPPPQNGTPQPGGEKLGSHQWPGDNSPLRSWRDLIPLDLSSFSPPWYLGFFRWRFWGRPFGKNVRKGPLN